MPIEIKELHIKINVEERSRTSGTNALNTTEKDAIVSECVEQVMEILAKKEER